MKTIAFLSRTKTELLDITSLITGLIAAERWQDGILLIFCPHTTASITLNENWDPDVRYDLLLKIDEVFADDRRFRHAEGNSDAHIKASLFGASQTVIIENGKLLLGQWQGIYFAEWDGPRQRQVFVKFISK